MALAALLWLGLLSGVLLMVACEGLGRLARRALGISRAKGSGPSEQ